MHPVRRFKQRHVELLEVFREHRDRALNDPGRLPELLDDFQDVMEPHARAEEELLYERLDVVAGTSLATAGLRADHERFREHVGELRAASEAEPTELTRALIADQLQILSVLLSHHVEKERTILLPYLEEELSGADVEALFESVHHERTD